MNLHHLRYLVALADEQSFTRAAARCWVSQQAFSKAIAQLERQIGATLVVRRTRGCSLTPAGERLTTAARGILTQADHLSALADLPPPGDDVLRVGLLLDGLGPVTRSVLQSFQAVMPDVQVVVQRLQPHELTTALVGELVDVALLHGPFADDRIETTALFSEPRTVVLSMTDARSAAATLTADDLLNLPARERRDGIPRVWEGFFTLSAERSGAEPERRGAPAGSLEELLYSISLEGLFLTAPEHLADTYPAQVFGVSYVPVPDLPPVVFSVSRRRNDTRPTVTTFVDLVTAATR